MHPSRHPAGFHRLIAAQFVSALADARGMLVCGIGLGLLLPLVASTRNLWLATPVLVLLMGRARAVAAG